MEWPAKMLMETEEVGLVADEPSAGPRLWRRRAVIAVVIIVVIVAAGGAGVGTWLATRTSTSKPALQVSTETVAVTTGTMKETQSASGTIEPAAQADLSFAVSGQVTGVRVVAGQRVRVGQTLAKVDPSALRDTVDADSAALSSARARLASDKSAAASVSQIDSDQASVTSAKTQLTTARTDLADAKLRSTIRGTVASVDLTVGQQVTGTGGSAASSASGGASSSGASTNGGSSSASSATSSSAVSSSSSSSSAQIVVISTDSYVVSTTVDDTQIGEVKTGDQADITPSGSSTVVYGVVSSVGLIASSSSDVATFPVTITVTGTQSGLYAGSSATVSIIVKQLNDVIEVPTPAISYSTSGQATVTVVTGGKHVSRAIKTGETSGTDTQVTSGLSAGQQVVERVVKFNGTAGGTRSLLGGGTGGTGGGFGGFGGLRGGGRTGTGVGGAGG
jgi:macrolide-specific efflux system membrane fusion protein